MFKMYNNTEAVASLNAEHIHHLSVASILDEDQESPSKRGLQRMLTKSRVNPIAKFFLRNGNRICLSNNTESQISDIRCYPNAAAATYPDTLLLII